MPSEGLGAAYTLGVIVIEYRWQDRPTVNINTYTCTVQKVMHLILSPCRNLYIGVSMFVNRVYQITYYVTAHLLCFMKELIKLEHILFILCTYQMANGYNLFWIFCIMTNRPQVLYLSFTSIYDTFYLYHRSTKIFYI